MSPALPRKLTRPPMIDPVVLKDLCENATQTSDAAVLQALSTHAHPDIRRAVAGRIDLTETLYRQLSQDPVTEVRTLAMRGLLRRKVAGEQRSDLRQMLRTRTRPTR